MLSFFLRGELKVPPPSFLFIPMISAGKRTPGNPCSLTFSPSFLLLQVHPASPGVGEGYCLPSLGLGQPPLDTQEQAPELAQWQFPNVLLLKLDGSSETISGPSELLGRLRTRVGQG